MENKLTLVNRNILFTESERKTLTFIRRNKECTQNDLNEISGLSQQSISRIIAQLKSKGLIIKERTNVKKIGQPTFIIKLNPEYTYSIGISIMTDSISIMITDLTGSIISYKNHILTDINEKTVLKLTGSIFEEMLKENLLSKDMFFGGGVSISGYRLEKNNTFNTPISLDSFAKIDIEKLFSTFLNMPIWAENDGKVATLVENMSGIGNQFKNFAYFYIASGFGGGIISDGKLLYGKHGNAGEFRGALSINESSPPTLEGLRIHLKTFGYNLSSVTELIEKYDDQWDGLDTWVENVSIPLSIICTATSAILDTDVIILGGRIPPKLGERLIKHIKFSDINLRNNPRLHSNVVVSKYEGDVAAFGASSLPFLKKFYDLY
jgi:predicted NBD/HSP70 family sugar kinase